MDRSSISPELQEIFKKGIGEVLSPEQSRELFTSSDRLPFLLPDVSHQAVKDLGNNVSSGLFFRAGTAGFKYLVSRHGKAIGIDSLEFRMQPQRRRLLDGLDKITTLLKAWKIGEITLSHEGDNVDLYLRGRGEPSGDGAEVVWLHFTAGMIQEYLYWAGAGKQYPFKVKTSGDGPDTLVICFQLQPVD